MVNEYSVVVEQQPGPIPTDYQIAIYRNKECICIPIKYMDKITAIHVCDNYRRAFDAGMNEAWALMNESLHFGRSRTKLIY
jgi:hypothetical protein